MDHCNIDLETVPAGYRVFVVLCYAQTTGKCAVAVQPVRLSAVSETSCMTHSNTKIVKYV